MPKTTAYSYRTKHTDIDLFKRKIAKHAALANVRLLDDNGATTFQDFFRAMPRAKKMTPPTFPLDCCDVTDEEMDAAVARTRAQLDAVNQQLEEVNGQIERIENLIKTRF